MRTRNHRRRIGTTFAAVVIGTIVSATALIAHDFWLVPNALTFTTAGGVEVLGQSGTRFPTSGGPTQPTAVAEARIVGRSSDEKVTDLSVAGKSLMLKHKPRAAGQYVVGVALTSRTAKTTPDRLQRYIALEGAPELAAQYEKDGKYPKVDSVTQQSAKFAKTIVEVGEKGARAFDKALGHALELIPLDDPAAAKAGGAVRVKLLFHGKPVAGAYLRAGWGSPNDIHSDPPAGAPAKPDQVIQTSADGVASVAISEGGLWNVRTLYAAGMQGMPEHWEVYFATMVFTVSGANASGDDSGVEEEPMNDSTDVVAALAKFHASLAAGDSTAALSLLAEDVSIIEGRVETKEAYRSGHLKADMEYAKAVPSQRTVSSVRIRGDVAWVISNSTTQGEFRGRQINSTGLELAILSRESGGWRIRAMEWTSQARRAPGGLAR